MKRRASHLIPSQQSERGFALPVAMGMGLIAIVIALTAVARSQNDRITALNKKETGTSLNAAEAGATQVQEFLNRNRALANYNLTSWATSNAFCGSTTASEISQLTSGDWIALESSDSDIASQNPQYRIKNYVASSTGELTIEGIVNEGKDKESTSEIIFEFPVFSVEDRQAASLWATDSIAGTTQVQSDIYTSCGADTGSIGAVGDRVIVRSNSSIPETPATPSNAIVLTSIKDKRLPIDGDSPALNPDGLNNSGDEVYYYAVSSLDGSFSVKDREKVYLWVTGDTIDLRDRNVYNECNIPSSLPVNSSGTAFTPTCGAFDFKLYGPSSTSTGTLLLNEGTSVCDVHFHLPNYAATFSSGGTAPVDSSGKNLQCDSSNSTIRNTGIYWVKSWSDAVGTTIYPASSALWRNANIGSAYSNKLPPRIGPIENWKFQGEVE